MSRAFVAFYMGDYQKKTQHLDTLQHGAYILLLQHCWIHGRIPLEAASRANIAKMTLPAWKKIAPVINAFFDEEGCNKRAAEEIAKAEDLRTKRSSAGFRGGINSGISKAIAKGRASKYEANAYQNQKQTAKQNTKQTGLQNGSPAEAIKNSKINSSSVAAREGTEESKEDGSLASAHFEGALREPKEERKQGAINDPVAKPLAVVTQELAAFIARNGSNR
jgi:uncharacterized protein YdaU (DUF1376 family)